MSQNHNLIFFMSRHFDINCAYMAMALVVFLSYKVISFYG